MRIQLFILRASLIVVPVLVAAAGGGWKWAPQL
jgi:hypothetical protein